MNVSDLVKKLNLEVLNEGHDVQVVGCYACDLLSVAMSSLETGNIWITVQTNMNILGIAALAETSCVIVAHGMNIPDAVIAKAKEENICLLRSEDNIYELCNKIGNLTE